MNFAGTFLKETSVKRVWSFKGRVGQDITNVNELQNFNGDNSMAVPMCITFEEYYLFIQNVADDFCLQSGGGMNAYVTKCFFFFFDPRNTHTHTRSTPVGTLH